jgi:hypothetical protein
MRVKSGRFWARHSAGGGRESLKALSEKLPRALQTRTKVLAAQTTRRKKEATRGTRQLHNREPLKKSLLSFLEANTPSCAAK